MPDSGTPPPPDVDAAASPASLANIGIACGVLGFLTGVSSVAGVILGLVAFWRTRSGTERKARAQAVAGIVISWTAGSVFAFWILVPTCCTAPSPGTQNRVLAQKTATELRTGMMSYSSEYKRLPALPSATKDGFGDDLLNTRNSDLVAMLLGPPSGPASPHNRRQIAFLSSLPAAKSPTTRGFWKDPVSGRHHLLDPWGQPYYLLIDANADLTIHPPSRPTSVGRSPIYTTVAVWSYGKDGVSGGGDDIFAY